MLNTLKDWWGRYGFQAEFFAWIAVGVLLLILLPANEYRVTDVLIVFFTYCLVIVGWFGIRSNQRTVRDLERAYLWPGFGLLVLDREGALIGIHLGIRNTGRTAGIIKTVHHALISKEDYDAKAIITYGVYSGREDAIVPDPNFETRSGVWHRLSEMPKVSCGWITYIDVFKTVHRQGWKHIVDTTGRTESFPGCYTDAPWTVEHEERQSDQELLPLDAVTRQIQVNEAA
jgi:hypothetical protein